MNSSTSFDRLAINRWAPCPAVPAADALQQSRELQDDVRMARDEQSGVIRLYVAADMPSVEPDRKLAAS